jgi:beta-aspartyl-peptidase (threonine type)
LGKEIKMISIIVHGGAGKINPEEAPERVEICKIAASTGYKTLEKGGSAIEAVVKAVMVLEDHPLFNAGRGSTLNWEGKVEMDAAIMDGSNKKMGALAEVSHIKNPITLARAIMEGCKHTFLVGEGAEEFAREQSIEFAEEAYFYTERTQKIWENRKNNLEHDTVGAIALDSTGRIVAGVSTGGTSYKHRGRVGDSPVVGSGFYANKLYGAVATGIGEDIMRTTLSVRVMFYVAKGLGLQEALDSTIKDLTDLPGEGGIIGIDNKGTIAFSKNTTGMLYAFIKEGMKNPIGGF